MGDVVNFRERVIARAIRDANIRSTVVNDVLTQTLAAYDLPATIVPMNQELPYQQSVMVGAVYPAEVIAGLEEEYKPWFLFIDLRYVGAEEIQRRVVAEDWTLRNIEEFKDAYALLDPDGYMLSIMEDPDDLVSPWFSVAFTLIASMMWQYGLQLRSVGITAEGVLQVKMVGEHALYQIDLEGPTLQRSHKRLQQRDTNKTLVDA